MVVPVIAEHIEITPGTCGGRPRIAGHRIRVQDVVFWHERQGQTVAAIVATYPGITPADVHAALAYYHDHIEEIHEAFRRDEEFLRDLQASQPSLLDRVREIQRIRETRGVEDAPLPPG